MSVRQTLAESAEAYFRRRYLVYLLVAVLFAAGSVFGALAASSLAPGKEAEVAAEVRGFVSDVRAGTLRTGPEVVLQSLQRDALQTAGLCWLLGLSLVGVPLVLVLVFYRGFLLGFTVAALVKELAFGGVLASLVAVLPANLLMVPAIVVAGVSAISFGVSLVRSHPGGRPWFLRGLAGYTGLFALVVLAMAGAALIEGYVTPVLLEWTLKYFV